MTKNTEELLLRLIMLEAERNDLGIMSRDLEACIIPEQEQEQELYRRNAGQQKKAG